MEHRQELIDRIERDWPHRPLELNAEGNFHVILGTKDEHDGGIKVYAANPEIIEKLLNDEAFDPDQYYCTVEGSEQGVKFEPDEMAENLDQVASIGAIDGMLPYDKVKILTSDGEIDIEETIDLE